MEKRKGIQAVELIRQIRDSHARKLEGRSDEEIIAFFRKAGDAARQQAEQLSGSRVHRRSGA